VAVGDHTGLGTPPEPEPDKRREGPPPEVISRWTAALNRSIARSAEAAAGASVGTPAEDVRARVEGKDKFPPYANADIKRDRKKLDLEDRKAVLAMKQVFARGVSIVVGLQLAMADAVFFIYGVENNWQIPGAVMIAWLSATMVQSIGIVYIIARHLFPPQGK
jgi:hypothetical protein